MSPLVQDIIRETVDRIVAEFRPRYVYLFGSHAWGNPTPDSDIDLMVVVDRMPESPAQMTQRAYRALRGRSYPTDILFRSTEYFNQQAAVTGTLEYEVARRGERLHG